MPKGNLLVDISVAIEPHLRSLSAACTDMIESGRRMREAIDSGDMFVAGMQGDELARASERFRTSNQGLTEAAVEVYATYGKFDTAVEVVQDAVQWAGALALKGSKPVGQA